MAIEFPSVLVLFLRPNAPKNDIAIDAVLDQKIMEATRQWKKENKKIALLSPGFQRIYHRIRTYFDQAPAIFCKEVETKGEAYIESCEEDTLVRHVNLIQKYLRMQVLSNKWFRELISDRSFMEKHPNFLAKMPLSLLLEVFASDQPVRYTILADQKYVPLLERLPFENGIILGYVYHLTQLYLTKTENNQEFFRNIQQQLREKGILTWLNKVKSPPSSPIPAPSSPVQWKILFEEIETVLSTVLIQKSTQSASDYCLSDLMRDSDCLSELLPLLDDKIRVAYVSTPFKENNMLLHDARFFLKIKEYLGKIDDQVLSDLLHQPNQKGETPLSNLIDYLHHHVLKTSINETKLKYLEKLLDRDYSCSPESYFSMHFFRHLPVINSTI